MSDENEEVTPEHVCPNVGQMLVNLYETMLVQFRTGTVEQVKALSTSVHSLQELVAAIEKSHDSAVNLVNAGDMGADKQAAGITRIRKERSDKKAKKAGKDFTKLSF